MWYVGYANINTDFSEIFKSKRNIPIKDYGLNPYFRSAAALSDAPPPLPVNLAACGCLAGGDGKFLEFSGLFSKTPRNWDSP